MPHAPLARAPRVTVLMPVYNAERHLAAAVESVLRQSYGDFELLAIDDGSTDRSAEILRSYSDPRIRLVTNAANLRLISTLNRGLELARGEYVIRMDADDVSLPERFSRQVEYMDRHPEIGIAGTWVQPVGEVSGDAWRYPSEPARVRAALLFGCVLAHPSVIMRRQLLERHRLRYDPAYPHAEDYELWVRAAALFPLGNLPEVLLQRRVHAESVGGRHAAEQARSVARIRAEQIQRLGIRASAAELALHRAVSTGEFPPSRELVLAAERWLLRLLEANERAAVYDRVALARAVAARWTEVCQLASGLGWWSWRRFRRSPLAGAEAAGARARLRLLARCLLRRGAVAR